MIPQEKIDRVMNSLDIVDFISGYVQLKKKGNSFMGLCPFHEDTSPSFSVHQEEQYFHCFGCGEGGNIYAFVMKIKNIPFDEAFEMLTEKAGMRLPEKPRSGSVKKSKKILPVPTDIKPPNAHPIHGKYSEKWAYKNINGETIGYDCRFEIESDRGPGKQILPLTYNHKTKKWEWKGFLTPRPLYGLEQLKDNPNCQILFVEGAKCAKAAQKIFDGCFAVMSWVGGVHGVKSSDFSPVKNHKIILWEDNDEPGKQAMLDVYEQTKSIAAGIRFVKIPAGKPKKWDIYDAIQEGWTQKKILDYMSSNLLTPDDVIPKPDDNNVSIVVFDDAPFRCLGYFHGLYHYITKGKNQVIELTPNNHTSRNLITLANIQYWERNFHTKRGPDWLSIWNTLQALAEQVGVYNPGNIRGTGIWMDNGRVVVHTGNRLIVDGVETNFIDIKTEYIYESTSSIKMIKADPLDKNEANKVIKIMEMLAWVDSISARILAGWCVIAPLSGALQWRPHIWLAGKSGGGKTWIMNNIIQRLMGPTVFRTEGSGTTEPGMRGHLLHNAVPVLHDEADAETHKAKELLDAIFILMRSASSANSGLIVKGTTTPGKVIMFRARSCFCFASVGISAQQRADLSRITPLSLGIHKGSASEKRDKFNAINKIVNETLSVEWCAGFRARAIKLLPAILKNIEIFSEVGAKIINSQRDADQIAPSLAGAYSLYSDSVISEEKAAEWMENQNWNNTAFQESESDETRCLNTILQYIINIVSDGKHQDVSILSLITIAANMKTDGSQVEIESDEIMAEIESDKKISEANDILTQHGIRVSKGFDYVYISNSHAGIKQILRETPWAVGWHRILVRIDGTKEKSLYRFQYGMRTRAVGVSMGTIFDNP